MDQLSWLSLLPPLLAILLAVVTRHVYLSLFFGIVLGYALLSNFNPITGLQDGIDGIILVFTDPGDAKIIVFSVLIGSLLATLERNGGVKGFIQWVETKPWLAGPKHSQWMAWMVGVVIFVESNMTILVAGNLSRPLFDKYRVSREKLAYIIDSTSAPISLLIPLNAWGAFNLGILSSLGVASPLDVFITAWFFNFYAIASVALTAFTIAFNWNIGPMKQAELRTQKGELLWPDATPLMDTNTISGDHKYCPKSRAKNMLVPILAMVVAMPLGLYMTGDGNLAKGSGSDSVLWAVLVAIAFAWVMTLNQRLMNLDELTKAFLEGASGLMPLVLILVLSLAFGDLTKTLGTGDYLAGILGQSVPPSLLLPLVFLATAVMAFSIGTSWGTFAIMIPIAVPLAMSIGLNPAPFFAAVLSGGIFGDHASPISDTTVVSSMSAATDHIDHVKTQLPYALVGGGISLVGFWIVGLFFSLT